MSEFDDLRKALGQLPEGTTNQEHLDELVLADYLDNLLDPELESSIQSHLAICRACAQIVLDLNQPFVEASEAVEPPAAPGPGPSQRGPQSRKWITYLSIAANLLLALLLLQSSPRPNQPGTNIQELSLEPWRSEVSTSRDASAEVLSEPRNMLSLDHERFWIFLNWREPVTHCEVELSREQDTTPFWHGEMSRTPNESFKFELVREGLAPGAYRITLTDPSGHGRETFLFTVGP